MGVEADRWVGKPVTKCIASKTWVMSDAGNPVFCQESVMVWHQLGFFTGQMREAELKC
jgi:hypothetical protein